MVLYRTYEETDSILEILYQYKNQTWTKFTNKPLPKVPVGNALRFNKNTINVTKDVYEPNSTNNC